nr:ribonuclease H-like domain-containing protein [Tanacetum cinerariifolium]
MNIWKVIQNGISIKRTGRDHDERVIILSPTTAEEHIAVQRESKARTTLLQSIPDDHVADFHYTDDARDIWNAVKTRFGEGLHKGYDMMQKILSQLNQLKAKPDTEDINLKFLRDLPSSWSQVALTLKTKGGLELLSFDDLYYKLKTLEVDVKGYSTFSSSQSVGPCHSTFVSATSTSKKMSFGDSLNYSLNTTYSVPSNSKNGSHRSGNVIEDVLKSFVTDTKPEQKLAYEDLEQIEKLDLEEMDLKWKMAMLSVRVHKFEQKARRKIDFDKKESARFNKKKRYSSFKIKEIGKKEEDSKALITVDTLVDWTNHDSESDGVIAAKEFEEANTAGDAGEFALMGVTSELTLEDEIRVLSIELENTSNLLKHSERINADFETAKKDLQTKLDNHLVQTEKWRNSSKNLFRLIDSSISVKTKVGLGFTNCISKNKLGWDDCAFSIFTTNSEDVEGRPIFHSDQSSEVNTNDFASSDSSVKYSEHQPNDSTSCASTSSVSTSVNEVEIESNVGKSIKEPSIVQDLPSFTCNSFDKNEHTSRTSCNKNGYFNKKAGHFRKHASSVSKTGKVNIPPVRPQPVLTGKPKVSAPVPICKPKVFTPVPTGKPKVSTLVPTGRPNRPFPFPTDRGFSSSVISGWWSRICGQLLLSPRQVVLGNHIEKVYIGYPKTIADLIHQHTDDNVADLLTKAFDGPRYVVTTGRYVVPTGRVIVATGRMDPSGGTSAADELKKLTVKNRYLLPSIDDLIDQLRGLSSVEVVVFLLMLMLLSFYCRCYFCLCSDRVYFVVDVMNDSDSMS